MLTILVNILVLFPLPVFCDFDGLFFEDDEHKILSSAVPGITKVIIPNTVEIINGGDKNTDGFAYSINNSLESVDFNNAVSSLRIIKGYAFAYTKLKEIDLSSCVHLESIGSYAFMSCQAQRLFLPLKGNLSILGISCFERSKVIDVLLPSSVKVISNNCFYYSTSLSSFIFDHGSVAELIGFAAFQSTKLERITIPASMISVQSTAFVSCQNLIEISVEIGSSTYSSEYGILYTRDYKYLVVFPPGLQSGKNHTVRDGVEELMSQSFRTSGITGIFLPPSVKVLGMQALFDCYNLEIVEMTNNLVTISMGCFYGSAIRAIVIPSGITELPSLCFLSCTKLQNITLHNNIKTINSQCFQGCSSLISFEIPEGVTTVSSAAFAYCKNLVEVWLPQSIETLGGGLFEGCHKDLKVRFRTEGKFSTDDQFIIYSDNMTNVVQMFALPQDPNIILLNNVTTISEAAFASSMIESIKLSESLLSIGSRAFAKCPKLSKIMIPLSVQSIGSALFSDSSIGSIDLGRIPIIPSHMFLNCQIAKVRIPSSVESIQSNAFSSEYISDIEFEENSALKSVSTKAFTDCSSLSVLSLPSSITNLESEIISGNSVEKIIIEDGANFKSVPYGAFMNSKRLKEIIFSNVTEMLDKYSIAFCTSLKEITISSNIRIL